MSALYQSLGITRQGHAQGVQRQLERQQQLAHVITLIRRAREEHPRMGLRKLHRLLGAQLPVKIGRDAFIALGMAEGLAIPRPVNHRRTTFANRERQFPNLLIGRQLNDVNQVWVSDLTYYWLGTRFSYITFVMDLYSRMIVSAVVSRSMHACWTVSAFEQAIAKRGITREHRIVFHSDAGGQYISKNFQDLAGTIGAAISTSEIVYENAHAERLNGIIKYEYLDAWSILSHVELERHVPIAIERYNTTRPHQRLGNHSPTAFETSIATVPIAERPTLTLWPPRPLEPLTGRDVPYKP